MKSLLTLLLALLALTAQAQKAGRLTFADLPMDSTTHLVTYAGVVPVAGATKDQLFARAKEWAARSFADSKAAVRLDDKDAGTYIARGNVKSADGSYELTVAIYTKDGRYKYVIDQITYSYTIRNTSLGETNEHAEHWATYGRMSAGYVSNRVKDMQALIPKLTASIQAAMQGSAGTAKSDSDW